MLKFLCLMVFVVGALATQFNDKTTFTFGERLDGGRVARRGQFPYQVSLQTIKERRHYCGGCLIAARFILSTATCTSGPNSRPYNVRVVVGAHLRNGTGGERFVLDRIVNHPNYVAKYRQNDISVLRTLHAIIYSNVIRPVALPTTDVPVEGNIPATISGWGLFIVSTIAHKIC